MKCQRCQTENAETRKFCSECGAKLLLICPQCGLARAQELIKLHGTPDSGPERTE